MKSTAILLTMMLFVFASANLSTAATCNIDIAVCIDHEDRLIIKGKTAQWHHLQGAKPGEHDSCGADNATVINGVEWFPSWPTESYSDVFGGVFPPLPARDMTISLNSTGRGTVEVYQQPNAENDYSLIIHFYDGPGEAAPYTASFEFECEQPIPSLGHWGLAALSLLLAGTAAWMVRRRHRSV